MKSSKFLWINLLLLQVFLLGGTNVYATGISSEMKPTDEFHFTQAHSNKNAYLPDEAFSFSEKVNAEESDFSKFFGSLDSFEAVISEDREDLQIFTNFRFHFHLKKILFPFHSFW
jgi:hypothetical protein